MITGIRRNSFVATIIISIIMAFFLSGCEKSDTLVLSGTVESTHIDANAEIAGKVTNIEKDAGTSVKKGDVLAVIDSSMQDLVVKQQEAVVRLKQAKLDELESAADKSQTKDSQASYSIKAAQADLEQSTIALEQTRLVLRKYRITSPIDGTYLLRNINAGDMVNIGTSVATISDLTDLWVIVYIPQKNINSVSLDQELDLKSVSMPEKTIGGKIVFIAGEAEFTPKNTETSEAKENTVFRLKVKITDNIKNLKPGMTVDVNIPLQ